jgi:hypothetical protein
MATRKPADPTARPKQIHARAGDGKFVGEEPVWDTMPDNRRAALMRSLNWYNYNCDSKQAVEFVVQYLETMPKRKKLVQAVKSNPDSITTTIGWVCRMLRMGWKASLSEMRHVIRILDAVPVEKVVVKAEKSDEPAVWKPNIQDRLREMMHECAGDIEGGIDDFVTSGCKEDKIGAFTILKQHNLPQVQASKMIAMFTPRIAEVTEALEGKDAQLKEGYSFLNKVQMKALIKAYGLIVKDLESYVNTKKVARKPRLAKPKSVEKITAKVKFKKEDTALKVVSAQPAQIVGASEVWVFNTKTRKLGCYIADSQLGPLGIKGTSITGFDAVASIQKTMRKPAEQVKEFMGMTKAGARKWLKGVRSVDTKLNGRLSEDILILRAFK